MLPRLPRPRPVSWTTDLAGASVVGAIPLLHACGRLTFPALLALVALIGAARGPGDLAKEIMVPEAAERGRVPLETATGLPGATERLALTLGPAADGRRCAGGAAGSAVRPRRADRFALGSMIIALALPHGMGDATERVAGPGYWRSFGEGLAFLRGEPLLLTVIVMVGITNLLDAAFGTVLLPVWAKASGNGAAAIGMSTGVLGATAIAGSLTAAALAHRMRRRPVFFAGFLLAGAPRFLVLALHAPLWAVVLVFAAGGFGAGFLNPILGAISFERVPRHLLGRVSALGDSPAWAGMPLGGHAAGWPDRRGRRGLVRAGTRAAGGRRRVLPHDQPDRPAAGMARDGPPARPVRSRRGRAVTSAVDLERAPGVRLRAWSFSTHPPRPYGTRASASTPCGYYERIGLLGRVARDHNGRRRFDEDDLTWLRVLVCLRETGMPIARMRRYAELVRGGEDTIGERVALLSELDARVEEQIETLRAQREHLRKKLAAYREMLAAGQEARR